MGVAVKLGDLADACEWVAACESNGVEGGAGISRSTGTIHWYGEGVDEEEPADIMDESRYVAVPPKSELDLLHLLPVRFAEEHLPGSLEEVREFFHRRGAYSRFKSLLERQGKLEEWYRYEQDAIEYALRQWCLDNGFDPVD